MAAEHVKGAVLILLLLSMASHRLQGAEGCIENERRALLAVKSDMYDPGGTFSSWTGDDCCNWRGVACNNTTDGHVTKLDLHYPEDDYYFIRASKVNPSLLELKHLKYLDLSMNDFDGADIPITIASLVHLEYLNLSYACFSGSIPPQLGNLSSLRFLDLGDGDQLNSDDLDWLSRIPSLKYLDMSVVDLSRATAWLHQINSIPTLRVLLLSYTRLPSVPSPFPPFNLTSISRLDLSSNRFDDSLLRWLSNGSSLEYLYLHACFSNPNMETLRLAVAALSNLKELDLASNHIRGEISGILRNASRRLEHLVLAFNSLRGGFPRMLGNLTRLRHLDLSSNQISGDISPIVGNLVRLEHLDLGWNSLTGAVPQMLGNLTRLRYFDLWSNQISGEISVILRNASRRLEHLDLAWNSLTGAVPQMLGNLTRLRYLNLWSNQISGEISPNLGNLVHLEFLDLSSNHVCCRLPWSMGNLTNLVYLDLSDNNFSGEIPESFGNLYNLKDLRLFNNNISAQLPQTLGNLRNLQNLYLSNNSITGEIPETFGKLNNLEELDISSNQLSGQIPRMAGLCNLTTLVLSHNNISGGLTDLLDGLLSHCPRGARLYFLYLDGNNLSGMIPETFGKLNNLEELDISSNQLSGQIPTTMAGLCNLSRLFLSDNKIGGELTYLLDGLSSNCPRGARLQFLLLGGNNLSGMIPSTLGHLSQLMQLDLSSNSLRGNITEAHFTELANLVILNICHNSLNVILPNDWHPPFNAWAIEMSFCHVRGKLSDWIRTQSSLRLLSLSGVGLSGDLPAWFSDFISEGLLIELDLSSNNLSGILPFTTTRFMDLSNNSFVGLIPFSLLNSTKVSILSLSYNHISGTIPSSFCNLTQIRVLDLSRNHLSGQIPSCHDSLPTSLLSLHLNGNDLSGPIPSFLANCKDLVILDLGENKFYGEMPTWLGRNLSALKVLRLRSNILHSVIPENLANLTSVQLLDLSFNKLYGSIPSSIGNLNAMIEIQNFTAFDDIYGNNSYVYINRAGYKESITVTAKGLTEEYTTVLSLVTSIDLSNNNLSGKIPEELTYLLRLHFLSLSNNHLIGSIPENIGAMKQLESLDLSMNNLTEEIPSSLSALYFLSHLNLSHNDLSGRIPTSGQLSTLDDPSIYAGNKDLCGFPLAECPPSDGLPPPGDEQEGEEENDERLEKVLEFGAVALGFVVGFWGCIGYMIMKPRARIALFRSVDKTCDWIYVQLAIRFRKLKSVCN